MAKGLRHRENFDEIVGHLSRDTVHLTLPNRMALMAMNNKVFANGMEAHLAASQRTNPAQQVAQPPGAAPYVPVAQQDAAAPAAGPPGWMQGIGGLAGKLAGGGAAVAKTIYNAAQSHAAAAAATDEDDYFSTAGDFHSQMSAGDFDAMQHELLEQDIREQQRAHVERAVSMFHQTHTPPNPWDAPTPFQPTASPTNPWGGAHQEAIALGNVASGQSTAQILQGALEDRRHTYQHDGSDLLDEPMGRAMVRGGGFDMASRGSRSRSGTGSDVSVNSQDLTTVPGSTPDEKLDYLLRRAKTKAAAKRGAKAKGSRKFALKNRQRSTDAGGGTTGGAAAGSGG
jgi:hypothetical protein